MEDPIKKAERDLIQSATKLAHARLEDLEMAAQQGDKTDHLVDCIKDVLDIIHASKQRLVF